MAKVNSQQETQPIDSTPSSPSHSGDDKDGWIGNCDTEPFEDDAWINDHYVDTQVMDTECDKEDDFLLCGETQALDLGFESQEELLVDGKQLLEGSDCLVTQVLDRFDDEVTTVVLEDNCELSDSDDSLRKGESLLSGEDNRQHADEKVKSTGALDARTNEHGISGKVARFASVRSAAFRACAVAATLKFPNGDCSNLVNHHSSGEGATHNSNLEHDVGEAGNQLCPLSISAEKKDDLRKGNRTARKLFLDDLPEENGACAGLSYIDSQEPGEASQASALNLVDKLISESYLEFGLGIKADCGRRTEEKSKFVPSVKGPQELVKKVSYKDKAFGSDIFNWDDNREDEGGGDICRRRKDEFFGVTSKARGSSTLPREQKRELIHGSRKGLGVAVDKKRAHSDSRLLQHSLTRSGKKIQAVKKNLGKELDEGSEDRNNKRSAMRDLVDLGYDAQVVAEAIDAVCTGDRGKFDAEANYITGQKLSPGEERGFSNCGVITRQSKGTKRIQAMGKDELLKRRMKKASPIPTKACRKNIESSSKDDQLPCYQKKRKVQTASRETKEHPVDELDEISKESKTRMFDRHEETEAGPDTQMAAEAINALRSGDGKESDCVIGKKVSPEEKGISSRGVSTRKSKRIKGIHALDNDLESLKPKTKKARSILSKACEKNMDTYSKNDKLDTPNEVAVSSSEKRRGELSNKDSTSKPLKQSTGGETEVLSNPKRRRSARISQEAVRSSDPVFDTPVKSKMPSKSVSPICMGDEYHRLSCTGSFKSNTTREYRSLTSPLAEPILEKKSTRKRRDLGSIRVLFSQHLDEDVIKHQKKILARFDISEASSMMEATHFIADNFMRTRNMLEAIASGKPVVTTQWLESINQVNIYVDEDLYILRDSKKEQEFGFNMGVSLARARQYPLLQGKRVFVTPNTKPGLNTITTLVKAVGGVPVERIGRSALSEDKVPDNLLVLSCEDDRDISIPFIERGAEVYSSELLLNGIVTQKLEYERYRLFADNVRRTRSTIWIRDGKSEFQRRGG